VTARASEHASGEANQAASYDTDLRYSLADLQRMWRDGRSVPEDLTHSLGTQHWHAPSFLAWALRLMMATRWTRFDTPQINRSMAYFIPSPSILWCWWNRSFSGPECTRLRDRARQSRIKAHSGGLSHAAVRDYM